ncbi:hypothetical protein Godav_009070, partial [Gossypium davidsonii]|nr:hypothetical protein [Gossypium davidsonii]
ESLVLRPDVSWVPPKEAPIKVNFDTTFRREQEISRSGVV